MGMKESKIEVELNPDFLPFLTKSDRKSVNENVNLSLAIYLFTAKQVTLARAAELASFSLTEFIKVLNIHNIAWAEYTDEHKQQDDDTIRYILENDKEIK